MRFGHFKRFDDEKHLFDINLHVDINPCPDLPLVANDLNFNVDMDREVQGSERYSRFFCAETHKRLALQTVEAIAFSQLKIEVGRGGLFPSFVSSEEIDSSDQLRWDILIYDQCFLY